MKRFLFAAAFLLSGVLAIVPPLAAQQPPNNNNNNQQNNQPPPKPLNFPLWKAELPGGDYIIARNSINAVSTQTYLLDGVARVTEVNISTAGVFQPRFYYLEMLSAKAPANIPGAQAVLDHAKEIAEQAANDASPDDQPWQKVVKNYPATTHAGTIEYRLDTAEQLQKLFESVKRTWLTGRSEVFTVNGVHPFNANEELKNKDADADKAGEGGPGSGNTGNN